MWNRTRFVPEDTTFEDIRREDKAEKRRMFNVEVPGDPRHPRFGFLNPMDEEYASVADLVEWVLDNERDTYSVQELHCVVYRTGLTVPEIKSQLADFGLSLEAPKAKESQGRGFTSNCHDRWSHIR